MTPLFARLAALAVLVQPLAATADATTDDGTATPEVPPALAAYQASRDAAAHDREGRWSESAGAWAAVIEQNPYHWYAWYRRANALYRLERFREAGDAYRRSWSMGGIAQQHDAAIYNAACSYALAGRLDDALDALAVVMTTELSMNEDLLRTDTDLDPLRGDPRFARLVPIDPPPGLSRDQAWAHDLDVFERRMKSLHYRIDDVTPLADLDRAIDDLRRAVPEASDDDLRLGIQRILVMVGDGHTGLRTWPRDTGYLPVQLYRFAEGLFVQRAHSAHAGLAGQRVVSFSGLSPDEALAAVEPLVARDNELGVLGGAPGLLRRMDVLRHVGLAGDDGRVEVVLEDAGGRRTTHRLAASEGGGSWVAANHDAAGPLPLYLQNHEATYWFTHLPEHDVVYMQHNACGNDDDEPFVEFCRRLFAFIEANEAAILVVDERFNGGGSSDFNVHLINEIIRSDRINRPGHLFVITGRRTFSAAMNMTTDLDVLTEAMFAGEPPASRPNFIGEGLSFTLPCSGIRVGCSTRTHQRGWTSADRRRWVTPDLYVPPTMAHYASNRDPVMEAILEFAAQQ